MLRGLRVWGLGLLQKAEAFSVLWFQLQGFLLRVVGRKLWLQGVGQGICTNIAKMLRTMMRLLIMKSKKKHKEDKEAEEPSKWRRPRITMERKTNMTIIMIARVMLMSMAILQRLWKRKRRKRSTISGSGRCSFHFGLKTLHSDGCKFFAVAWLLSRGGLPGLNNWKRAA